VDLNDARDASQKFLHETEGMWSCIEVAGSIRRQRPQVKDVDLVGIPVIEPARDLFGQDCGVVFPFGQWVTRFADTQAPGGTSETVKFVSGGESVSHTRKSVRFFWYGVEFDVWIATLETFALLWLIRTGPAEQNRLLALRAQRMGMRLAFAQGIIKGSQVLCPDDEQGVLASLRLPYVYPEYRDEEGWHRIIKSSDVYPEGSVWVPNGSGLEESVGRFVRDEQERAARREALSPEELARQAALSREELFDE